MKVYTVAHLFCGIGGGAKGFANARFTVDGVPGRFMAVGGVDCDPGALQAFEALTGAPGFLLDLFSREDYAAFHGNEPPAEWREAQPADLRRLIGASPDVLYSSPPCVGMSRLVNAEKARGRRYRAVNNLTVRGILLALSAWEDCPPRLILLENVPGLAEARGSELLAQIVAVLEAHDYSVSWRVECLGELGGLGARRRRLKLIARHRPSVPGLLFRPASRGIRSCGEVLGPIPMPEDPAAGPMHRLGRHSWMTWLRLALIPPGKDWRALKELDVRDGIVQGYRLAPMEWHHGVLGVNRWEDPATTITGRSTPTNGAYSVADPRAGWMLRGAYRGPFGVVPWDQPANTVMASVDVQGTTAAVADPRPNYRAGKHRMIYRVVPWEQPSGTVIGQTAPSTGGLVVSDPRPTYTGEYGQLGVVPWDQPMGTITGQRHPGQGRISVADPRPVEIPAPDDRGVWYIRSPWGAWNRPITRLEAAVLQGFDPADMGCGSPRMVLPGTSATQWQRWIGNAVPVGAAQVIAETCGRCLLGADLGVQTCIYSPDLVPWARPVAAALSVEGGLT